MDKQIRYLPDIIGNNKNNKVSDEEHILNRQVKNRIIVPIYGSFYSKGFILKDVFRNKILKHKDDYLFGGLRKEYTEETDNEIFSFVVVTNDKVSEKVAISYQAYGQPIQSSSEVTVELLDQDRSVSEIIPYSKIKNRPIQVTPTFHYHDIGDIEKMEPFLFYIDKIRTALFFNNKEFFIYLSKMDALLQVLLSKAINEYEYNLYKAIKKFYDDFTLDLFNLGKIKNYPLMTKEEGSKIAASETTKHIANKDEKYFSLKAIEGFSKKIYELFTNVEQTRLGSFEEAILIPTKEYLESMVIGSIITIPALNTLILTDEIKLFYPNLEENNCRYFIKKLSNKNEKINSCYLYVHRDEGRTYIMISYYDNTVYKTKFTKVANANDDAFLLNRLEQHKNNFDNPHLDDKRDVSMSQVENLPIATREDIICNLPVRKYVDFRGLLLYMKRFKTNKKDTREIYEQYSEMNQARIMQTIFSACGSWKEIDESTIELCKVINKEEDPWIRVIVDRASLFEGDEEAIFTIECSNHYIGRTLFYKLIPSREIQEDIFKEEFIRYECFETLPNNAIELTTSKTDIKFKPNFIENPVFIPIFENGSETPTPVSILPLPIKLNIFDYNVQTGTVKDTLTNSESVILKPEPANLTINITNTATYPVLYFFKITTSFGSTRWFSNIEQIDDFTFSNERFYGSMGNDELPIELGISLYEFRDNCVGLPETGEIEIEIRGAIEAHEEANRVTPRLIAYDSFTTNLFTGSKKVLSYDNFFDRNSLLSTKNINYNKIEKREINRGDLSHNWYYGSIGDTTVLQQTQRISKVTYNFNTREIETIVYDDPIVTTSSTTTTTTTTTLPPKEDITVSIDILNNEIGFDDEAEFRIFVGGFTSGSRRFKATLLDSDKTTPLQNVELRKAFLNDDEIAPRLFNVQASQVGNNDPVVLSYKTAFTIDNKFFLKYFYISIEDLDTGIIYKDDYWGISFSSRFIYPVFLGLKEDQVTQQYVYRETDINYVRNAYGDPISDPPPDELFYNQRINGTYLNNPLLQTPKDVIARQENENLPVTIHLKVAGVMNSGWRKESDYRDIVFEDLELRFFKDKKNNNTTISETDYDKEMYLPYKYNKDKNIIAIQVKSQNFTINSSNFVYDTLVMVSYGNPKRLVGYFFLQHGFTKIKGNDETNEIVYLTNYFSFYAYSQKTIGLGDIRFPSRIISSASSNPDYVQPIFNSAPRRKLPNKNYNVAVNYPNILFPDDLDGNIEDHLIFPNSKSFAVNVKYSRWSPSRSFSTYAIFYLANIYNEGFTRPIETVDISFWKNENETVPTVDGLNKFVIKDIHSPLYQVWKQNRTPSDLPISFTLSNAPTVNGISGIKKINIQTTGYITGPGGIKRKNCICEILINNYWLYYITIAIAKGEMWVGSPPVLVNDNQFITVGTTHFLELGV